MTVLKTVEDVGATLAWYPGAKPMVALGTTEASGAGFDDYGARLELHALDLTDESATSKPAARRIFQRRSPPGKAATPTAFACGRNEAEPWCSGACAEALRTSGACTRPSPSPRGRSGSPPNGCRSRRRGPRAGDARAAHRKLGSGCSPCARRWWRRLISRQAPQARETASVTTTRRKHAQN